MSLWTYDEVTSTGDNPKKTYSNTDEIENDSSYIYFAKKKTDSGWGDHVYAYFYGGGDLRKDNFQRACYSIWPGVAPVSTEYTTFADTDTTHTSGTDTHSDIYNYSYDGTLYSSGSTNLNKASPETTFTYTRNGTEYVVYKFRIPLGEKKDYQFVIFNDGLSKNGGTQETSKIQYSAGTLYKAEGGSEKHFYTVTDDVYETRGDYLYVKMNNTTMNTWTDPHITFYNASGTPILLGGTGYVMKYAGTKGNETYFKVPVPADAKKFSLNNGYDTYSNNKPQITKTTAKYDILTKVSTPPAITEPGKTDGNMVYTLSETALTLSEPTFSETVTTETVTGSYALTSEESPRGDFIFIHDENNTLFSGNAPTITFKNSAGSTISTVIANKHVASGTDQIYSAGIPVEAVSFDVTYGSSQTIADNPVYTKVDSSVTTGTEGNFTHNGMHFSNVLTDGRLTVLSPTFTDVSGFTHYTHDEQYTARGDLYLVCADKNDWSDLKVTFYNENGTAIQSDIHANYVGHLNDCGDDAPMAGKTTDRTEAVGDWFRVHIPEGAATFKAVSGAKERTGKILEQRTKAARYRNDYTLGDMQYRLETTGLTPIYPIFTEIPADTLPTGGTGNVFKAKEEDAASYINSGIVAQQTDNHTSALPVLYPTNTGTIKYTSGSEDLNYECVRFAVDNTWGSTITAYFGSTAVTAEVTTGTYNGRTVYYYRIPSGSYSKVYFTDGSKTTIDITPRNNGHGYMYYPSSITDSTYSQQFDTYNGKYLVQIAEPSAAAGGVTITVNATTSGGTSGYIWFYYGSNNNNESMSAYFFNSTVSQNPSPEDQGRLTEKSVTVSGTNYQFYGFKYNNSSYDMVIFYNKHSDNYK